MLVTEGQSSEWVCFLKMQDLIVLSVPVCYWHGKLEVQVAILAPQPAEQSAIRSDVGKSFSFLTVMSHLWVCTGAGAI